jgi:hypothetical protein
MYTHSLRTFDDQVSGEPEATRAGRLAGGRFVAPWSRPILELNCWHTAYSALSRWAFRPCGNINRYQIEAVRAVIVAKLRGAK